MSISGLHVTMVAALFGLLTGGLAARAGAGALAACRRNGRPYWAGCLAALVPVLLAGFAVPAQRTLYMLLVAALAMSAGALSHQPHAVPGAAVVLLIDPWAVLAAGFWLSFAAVGALFYVGAAVVGGRSAGASASAWASSSGRRRWPRCRFCCSSPAARWSSAAGQCRGDPGRQLRRHAAGAFFRRGHPWWPIAALAHAVLRRLMAFLRMVRGVAGLASASAAVVGGARRRFRHRHRMLPRGMPGRLLGVMLLPAIFSPVARPARKTW